MVIVGLHAVEYLLANPEMGWDQVIQIALQPHLANCCRVGLVGCNGPKPKHLSTQTVLLAEALPIRLSFVNHATNGCNCLWTRPTASTNN